MDTSKQYVKSVACKEQRYILSKYSKVADHLKVRSGLFEKLKTFFLTITLQTQAHKVMYIFHDLYPLP